MEKGWAYQHHVVELATKRTTQLVHKVLGFVRFCRAHDQCVKRNVVWVHILILHRHELFVHDVHLRIADSENVAFHISRASCLSVDLDVFGVHKTDAAAVHWGVCPGANVDEQPKLVVCVEPCEG